MIKIKNLSRIIVGLVFAFSGFAKGLDPLGTAYLIEEYFMIYGIDWDINSALIFSITISTSEFVIGASLLFNAHVKIFSWILSPLIVFLTFFTLYIAIYKPVSNCGCFGDVIKLTHWQTFYKNLFLIIFIYIIFIYRKDFISPFSVFGQNIILLFFVIIFANFSYYQYNHLPIIDLGKWKIGNKMFIEDNTEEKIYIIYKNIETGEKKEFIFPDYPWNDSIWLSKWEFIDQRTEGQILNKNYDLYIFTNDGEDITKQIIENQNPQLLFITWDIQKVSKNSFIKVKKLEEFCLKNSISIIGLSCNSNKEVNLLTTKHNIGFTFYNANDIILKTMIRSNPGLILLKDSIVLKKWHYNDFPDSKELEKVLKKY